MRARWRRTAALQAALLAACAPAEPPPPEVRLSNPRMRVDAESALLGQALDLAVDGEGTVYVLDGQAGHVLVLPARGEPPRTLGRRGRGPGELRAPAALAVDTGGDSVRVADRGGRRIQVFTRDGHPARALPAPRAGGGGRWALGPGGAAAFGTLGIRHTELALRTAPDGRPLPGLGRRVTARPAAWDFASIGRQIARGRVPDELRNEALPVLAGSGAWLVLLADPAVQRFAADGTLLWTRRLEAPELDAIREEFFRRNRRPLGASAFYPLAYVADAAEARGSLWVLLAGDEDADAVILVLSPEGRVRHRVRAEARGARQIAVDARGARLHLALASAEVVSFAVPAPLLRP